MITIDAVRDALSNVMEPDLGQDLITLNMVHDIHVEGKKVSFTVNLTTPACPLKAEIERACINAVHHLVSQEADVFVNMTASVQKQRIDGQGDASLVSEVSNIIAVASGKGGVGKSTISANLAMALAKAGAKVGLVDTDIYGPSIPLMFGINERPDISVSRKLVPLEKYGIKLLSMGFMVDSDQAIIWRGPMVSSAVRQFLSDAEWGELDYLILDLPPGTGDIQLTIVQNVPLTGAIIVSTPQEVALEDARKGVAMFNKVNVPILGIIENMAYFTDDQGKRHAIFGEGGARRLASTLEVPFLGEVPLEQVVREGGDEGLPVVERNPESVAAKALVTIAEKAAQSISIRNAALPATKKVEILFR
jgi:ATP-binding protein involved in chromosome partitioning